MWNPSRHKKRESFIKNLIRCHKATTRLTRQSEHGLMIRVALVDPGEYAACIQKHNPLIHKSTHQLDYYLKAQGFPAHPQIAKPNQFLLEI